MKIPKSIRKYIRLEKARVRKEVFSLAEREKLIKSLYEKYGEGAGYDKGL